MISDAISTDNLSTISAIHAQRDDESIILKDTETRKEQPLTPENKIPFYRPYQSSSTAGPSSKWNDELRFRADNYDSFPYPNIAARYMKQVAPNYIIPTLGGHTSTPKYDVNDIGKWLELYEYIGNANEWNEETKFNRLFQAFDNTPHLDYFLRLMRNKIITNWQNAKEAFLKRCSDTESLINFERIYQRKQQPNEDAVNYITSKEALLNKIKPQLPEEYIVSQIVFGFRNDIYDNIITSSIDCPIKTVDELINRVVPIEQIVLAIEKRTGKRGEKRIQKTVDFNDKINYEEESPEREDLLQSNEDLKNQIQVIKSMLNSMRFPKNRQTNRRSNEYMGQERDGEEEKSDSQFHLNISNLA